MDLGIIISLGSLLGLLATVVTLIGKLTRKAHEDGVKDQKMTELEKDLNGIGRKVNNLQQDHTKVNDKVIELESILVTKLNNIESMLKEHIREEKENKK